MLNTNETISPYALTTLQRVKDRLFDPNNLLTATATTTQNSTSLTSLSTTTNMQVGQVIVGSGIPNNTLIAAISGTTITLSQEATANASGVAITVINQPPAFDLELTRMIDGCTDFIERQCGKSGPERFPNDGHFVQKTYTNEVYSVGGHHQEKLILRNAPVVYLVVSAQLTQGSAVATNVTPSSGITPGMLLYAAQGLFPSGTTVLSVSGSTVTMSQPAQATNTQAVFEISGLISFQWRAGTPDNPNWTSFFLPQYELEQQGYSGIVRVYGPMPRVYSNMLRATYVAGYNVDWDNAGDNLTHTLPADLTNTCENLVVRVFKRRQLPGLSGETMQGGGTINWSSALDIIDTQVISSYRRLGNMF